MSEQEEREAALIREVRAEATVQIVAFLRSSRSKAYVYEAVEQIERGEHLKPREAKQRTTAAESSGCVAVTTFVRDRDFRRCST